MREELSPHVGLTADGERVRILDQSLLPNREVYLELSGLAEMVEAIRALRVRGAPAIGIFAGYGVYVLARQLPRTGGARENLAALCLRAGELVGLTGFEKSFPNQLSGGMRQRVGIARAYANDPKVMLMDEPFGHLDAQTRYMMEAELEKIWQKEKRTVVFVTNNSEEAVYLADRIIILTNTPTHIKEEIKVDLPRPRQYSDPAFLEIRRKIEEICDDTL